jgi:hypothetical protein
MVMDHGFTYIAFFEDSGRFGWVFFGKKRHHDLSIIGWSKPIYWVG